MQPIPVECPAGAPVALPLVEGVQVAVLQASDAGRLAAAYRRNREYLAPWEPARSDAFFTPAGQLEVIGAKLALMEAGSEVPWILLSGEQVVGTVTVTGIVRGPFLSAHLGYWVDRGFTGRGLGSAAAAFAVEAARTGLGLHRLQAAVLLDNRPSQRILERAGFEEIGVAARYLNIAGTWQDHRLYQRILGPEAPGAGRE
jgi:ribosomal-protein-alanine N-acetyltransferase